MSDPDYAFHVETELRDGTPATIRTMRADDRERVIAAFAKLDEMTIYTRFFAFHKQIPEHELARIDEIDVLVAVPTGFHKQFFHGIDGRHHRLG